MLTYDDCVALCAASKREIEAIAEHEHIPLIAAAEMANYLCQNAAANAASSVSSLMTSPRPRRAAIITMRWC